ncbi:MAG: CoA pyrophosphatase [Gemmatimonadetes bacterium]|nr:CoA pyrophosphatase [Gemmatimonadota bacterium]
MSDFDPRLVLLSEALSAYASDADDPPHPEWEERIHAAVALVVRAAEELDVLLIKRAQRESDPWSGHMALPGGRRDRADTTLVDTAVRETAEETGLALERGMRLGRLEEVSPQSRRLPDLTIFPFVFGVPSGAAARVASGEVEAVHWVPLETLRDPATRCTQEIEIGGEVRRFPCLRVAGDVVWGLTYRILLDFFRVWPEEKLRELRPG